MYRFPQKMPMAVIFPTQSSRFKHFIWIDKIRSTNRIGENRSQTLFLMRWNMLRCASQNIQSFVKNHCHILFEGHAGCIRTRVKTCSCGSIAGCDVIFSRTTTLNPFATNSGCHKPNNTCSHNDNICHNDFPRLENIFYPERFH